MRLTKKLEQKSPRGRMKLARQGKDLLIISKKKMTLLRYFICALTIEDPTIHVAPPTVKISSKVVQSTKVSYGTSIGHVLVVSCETLPIIRNTFNVPIPNDSDVSSMLFISSRQSIDLKHVQQTLILRSRDKSLGGKLFHEFLISNFSDQIEVIITNTYIHLTNNYKYYNYLLSRVILPSII